MRSVRLFGLICLFVVVFTNDVLRGSTERMLIQFCAEHQTQAIVNVWSVDNQPYNACFIH